MAEHGKKPIQAIVEDVKYIGKSLLVDVLLLPSYSYVTLAISGIQFENPGKDVDKDLKDEAKFFVEVRLLQRDGVQVFIEKADTSWAIGYLIHPVRGSFTPYVRNYASSSRICVLFFLFAERRHRRSFTSGGFRSS